MTWQRTMVLRLRYWHACLLISYATGTKQLVINAKIVERFKILRNNLGSDCQVEEGDANELNGIIVCFSHLIMP